MKNREAGAKTQCLKSQIKLWNPINFFDTICSIPLNFIDHHQIIPIHLLPELEQMSGVEVVLEYLFLLQEFEPLKEQCGVKVVLYCLDVVDWHGANLKCMSELQKIRRKRVQKTFLQNLDFGRSFIIRSQCQD